MAVALCLMVLIGSICRAPPFNLIADLRAEMRGAPSPTAPPFAGASTGLAVFRLARSSEESEPDLGKRTSVSAKTRKHMMNKAWIAVPSCAPGGIDAEVADQFGQCDLFTLVEVDDGKVTRGRCPAPASPISTEDCVVPVLNLLSTRGVAILIAGGMGRRPLMGFNQVGIDVYQKGAAASVGQAIDAFVSGSFDEVLAGLQLRQPRRRRVPRLALNKLSSNCAESPHSSAHAAPLGPSPREGFSPLKEP